MSARDKSLDRVDIEPGDDVLDAQLSFIFTMLPKKNLLEQVETVEDGEDLSLWRLFVTDFEPTFSTRKMVLRSILSLSFGASADPRNGICRLVTQLRQYQVYPQEEDRK